MNRGARRERYGRLASHADRLQARLEGLPFSAKPIAGSVLRVDLLEVEVLDVRLDTGQAPADASVVADDDARQARQRGSGDREAGRLEARDVPERRRPESQVGIVGEQRLSADGAAAADDPGVAAELFAGQVEVGQSVEGLSQAFPGDISFSSPGLGVRDCQGGCGLLVRALPLFVEKDRRRERHLGEHLGGSLGADLREVTRPADLVPCVLAQVPGHHLSPDEAVDRRERLGLRAQDPQLRRSRPVGREAGIGAASVGFECLLSRARERRPDGLRGAAESYCSQEAVSRQERRAEHLGERSRTDASLKLHLPQPVARMDVALSEEGVLQGRGAYGRNASSILFDRHAARKPGHEKLSALAWKSRGGKKGERRSGDEEKDEQRGKGLLQDVQPAVTSRRPSERVGR